MTKQFNKSSFWSLLSNKEIEKITIPIIQRAYTQGGRSGDAKIEIKGKRFLARLVKALKGEPITLDFVYCSNDKNKVFPLDGQQRLTTLFLLHWYIAQKEDKIDDNVKNVLKKFTYETRQSSRYFCEHLCDFKVDENSRKDSLSDTIKNQKWFMLSWEYDPSICSMFGMLDKIDSELKEDTSSYWDILTNNIEKCPIAFFYTSLQDLGLTDDLYIKMNARGLELTDFEKFKAALNQKIDEERWDDDKAVTERFGHKIDTAGTDIFWKNKSEENKIDEVYFAFFNRYFLNMLITNTKKDDSAEKLEKENSVFKYLDGDESNDSAVQYSSFDVYKDFGKDVFESLTKTLDNFHKSFKDKNKEQINSLFLPVWADKENKNVFHFIPEYEQEEDKNTITVLTRPQRVVFHAICKYFETGCFEEKSFKQWMRVVWNIVENSNSASVVNMISALRHIDKLAQYSRSIYEHLKDLDVNYKGFASDQMKEEREKACKISDNNVWEQKIIDAENTAFFKGSIRFMFTDENGYNWDLFDDRFEKSEKYFDKDGVAADYIKDALLLRVFISFFTEQNAFSVQYKYNIFDNKAKTWKEQFLINNYYTKIFDEFFKIDDIKAFDFSKYSSRIKDEKDEELRKFQQNIVETDLLEKIILQGYIYIAFNGYSTWYNKTNYSVGTSPSGRDRIFTNDDAHKILSKLCDDEKIKSEQRIEGIPFFYSSERGAEFYFDKNGIQYRWWCILKTKESKPRLQIQDKDTKEWTDIADISTIESVDDYFRKM